MDRASQILKIIEENPEIHIYGIIKESKFKNGVIQYYLRKLERQSKKNSLDYSKMVLNMMKMHF